MCTTDLTEKARQRFNINLDRSCPVTLADGAE